MQFYTTENKRLKNETQQLNSDDDFSDYIKNNDNPENDVEKKQRRGTIEKRRRDRINNSLTELKELVPNALTKQNTTKLEKAEILKLTVDYLKEMKNKDPMGLVHGSSNYYESRLAGFRECLSEITKYVVHQEGVNNAYPIYQGLMEHLQYYYQWFATHATYQSERTLPIDLAHRYMPMQSPFMAFDATASQTQHKVPSWSNYSQQSYSNNIQYANHISQCNAFPLSGNQRENKIHYDVNAQSPASSTSSGPNITVSSQFQIQSSVESIVPVENPTYNLSATQTIKDSIFNSFYNNPNHYLQSTMNNPDRDSLA